MKPFSYSVGSWAFGPVPDRYLATGYHERKSLEEILTLCAEVSGVSGVELPYAPAFVWEDNAAVVRGLAADRGLKVTALGVNVTGAACWMHGSLTSPDPGIRARAIKTIGDSIDRRP